MVLFSSVPACNCRDSTLKYTTTVYSHVFTDIIHHHLTIAILRCIMSAVKIASLNKPRISRSVNPYLLSKRLLTDVCMHCSFHRTYRLVLTPNSTRRRVSYDSWMSSKFILIPTTICCPNTIFLNTCSQTGAVFVFPQSKTFCREIMALWK
jgi:hypothetical protein